MLILHNLRNAWSIALLVTCSVFCVANALCPNAEGGISFRQGWGGNYFCCPVLAPPLLEPQPCCARMRHYVAPNWLHAWARKHAASIQVGCDHLESPDMRSGLRGACSCPVTLYCCLNSSGIDVKFMSYDKLPISHGHLPDDVTCQGWGQGLRGRSS
jgi:hypothetical protein